MRMLIFWIVFLFCVLFLETEAIKEKRCEIGLEIRRSPKSLFKTRNFKERTRGQSFTDILQCTVINGDFVISNIFGENYTNEDFPVFPYLREITGALLIYSAKGLTNLGHVFPNLKVIGGQTMVFKNSLTIYHNEDLRFIGLKNLKIIKNGGVRISDNPKLCFARSINWDNILIGNYGTFKIERNGYDSMFSENGTESCQDLYGCKVDNPENCENYGGMQSCWEPTACQTYCPYHKLPNNKIGPGCSSTGQKCHSSCLGGCEVPNDPTSCYACQKFELNGQCIDKCPNGTFVHLDNRCITEAECHNLRPVASKVKKNATSFKAFNGKCHYSCPDGYQEDPTNPHKCIICEDYCPVKCKGAYISSIESALMFEKCNVIEGRLEIQIEKCGKAEEFTKAFGNIREITGYLLIRFSPTFTSLHMFKNLEIIHGEELVNGRYALSVMELENLRQLFNQNITIKNGLINVESNPKLCFNKITEFVKSIGLENNITENGISKYSNGENAICEAPILLQILDDKVDERIFAFTFTGFKTANLNHTKLLGYKIYYKKVDKIDPDMEIGDDSNACDRWESKLINSGYARFENLEINTIYAYYIQTKVNKHPEAKNAVSKLLFHKTPFKTPEMPRIKRYEAIGPNKILLEWDPPIKPNGIITHYTVMWNAKSIGNNGTGHDSFQNNLHPQSSTTSPSLSSKRESSEIEKCHNIEAIENEESRNEGTEFEDSVLNVIYPPPNVRKPIEEYYFDQYSLHGDDPETIIEKSEEKYPEIINENKTFGRSNISTTRVILSGLFHYTEYYIQIIACQDITVPENFCSKQAASRIIRTHPIPENDIIDLNTIKVHPYLINGTEQEDSRIINWKIPENPNGAILGFRYKISTTNFEIDRKISKEDYEKSNGILIQGLQNGLYSVEIRTISSAGISEASVKKEFFKIHVFNWEIFFYKWLPLVVVISGFIFVVCRFCMEKVSKKHTQKVIPSKGQKVPLL